MSATELLEPILKGGIRSINFFNGRLLSAEDLSDEQNANRQARALVGQAVGEGVVYGLEVAKSSAGTNQSPVVTVSAGLAFNRRGQALRLPTPTDVALARAADSTAPSSAVLIFKDCQQVQGGIYLPEDGLHLLTVAPSEGREGRAPTSGLGNASAPCNARYTVEGVQFRLIELLKANELGDANTLRNRVAYQCFGIETLRQFERAPFGQPPRRYGLLDTFRPNTLSDDDVPLAAIYWTRQGGLEFIDLWSVRRRPVRPSTSERWGALVDDRRLAEAEAMLLQFQEQIAAYQAAALQSPINLGNYKADERFAYLPPVGLLPVGAGAFNWQTFLGPHAPPEWTNVDEGMLRSIIARSVFIDPVKVSPFAAAEVSGQSPPIPLTVYRIPPNNNFVIFARSTRGRIRVFLGPAHTNVPGNLIYAQSGRTNTRRYAGPTGTHGVYQIVGLDAGAYQVTVDASAFGGANGGATVTEAQTTDITFIAGAPGNINVTPKRKGGAAITDKVQSVTARPSQGGSPIQGDPAGGATWAINNLAAGRYEVAVSATDYLPHTPVPVVLAAGQIANIVVELEPVPLSNAVINLEVSDKTTNQRIDSAVLSAKATNLQPPNDVKQGEKVGSAWSIKQLAAGNYRVEVTATNYQPETVPNVALMASQQKTLPVKMQALPGTIALTITNKDNPQAPINDKVTDVAATSGQDRFTGTRDPADGKWKIRNLLPGTYSVTVTATGFQPKTEQNVAVQANQTKPLNIEMSPVQVIPGSLKFSIIDDRGNAIDDKVTGISATSDSISRPATQGGDGKWSIIGLPPGDYTVVVSATNYKENTVHGMEVVSGHLKTIQIALEPLPGSITVSASHSGTPINDKVSKVTANSSRGSFNGAPEGSQWRVSNLKPDTYSVTVEARNYHPKTEPDITLTPGQARTLNVAMEPLPGSIRLTINNTQGAPIDGSVTNVTANGPSGSVTGTRDPADGKWKIRNLLPGTYSVTVAATNYNPATVSGVQVTSASEAAATLQLSLQTGTVSLTLSRLQVVPEFRDQFAATITPGNLNGTFSNNNCQISGVPAGTVTVRVRNTTTTAYPETVFQLQVPANGQASATIPVAPPCISYTLTNTDIEHSHCVEPTVVESPPSPPWDTRGLDTPSRRENVNAWLRKWRDWVILTHPEWNLSSSAAPGVATEGLGSTTRWEGRAIFFRTDGGRVGLEYSYETFDWSK